MRKDYKVICFVKNEISNNRIEGLFAVFGSTFYPDGSFIDNFIFTDEPNLQVKFGANIDNKFLLISKDKTPTYRPTITNTDVWDILLVSQEYKLPEDFSFNKEILVMYHGSDADIANREYVETQIKDKVRKIKPGHHIANLDQYGYFLIKGIADAWDTTTKEFDINKYTQAKEKLIQWFGLNEKLNNALDFLHQSLGGTPADISILTNEDEKFDLQVKFKKDSIEKTLQEWIDELKGKKDAEYNKALVNVRDALLEQAGVTGEN